MFKRDTSRKPVDDTENRNQNDQKTRTEIPGDTDAPDIVGRTGEEMPEVEHDEVKNGDLKPTTSSRPVH